ncbi:hypothetical protein K461DRAFT_268555 [Myriangium duriaei CBS 260.36]|uniref:C2H2-type domain-containing protein n=1 Tax=Myriangium duriaei CBS 260.36 TaxID=1168546 RepID=A0A9P4J5A1_9PEZI|nr:hypothetical protein K461DRAFT_268555 [Myriangium duriaei CBS 260.36]
MATTTTYHPPASHFSPPSHSSTPSLRDVRSPRPFLDSAPRKDADIDSKMADASDALTPTRSDFAGIPGQKALPTTPFSPAEIAKTPETDRSDTDRDDPSSPAGSKGASHEDVEMGDDGDQEESDNESASSDPQQLKKKKKGQRFFCTDYPPCNLSFTRSEHLARHIRKHTGERPFQCHCGRRFSRLDNLRQHAQTVHVNEEIPGDSLAATGTRFQRQIRTDRVRAPGRARAGTGPGASHARGHSRNLSSSSITSTMSSMSAMPEEARRRPPPLAMAQENTPRRVMAETYAMPGGTPPTQYAYYSQPSPSGYSSPTSATFSTGGNSPRFPIQSPTIAPRAGYFQQPPPNTRRLSVPSVASPYQAYPPSYQNAPPHAGPYHSSTVSTSSIASPRASHYSHSRRESDAELEWRRRTWHPGTYAAHVQRPATSGLSYQQTPDDARPTTAGQPAATQITRLPGIESFDHAPAAASTHRPSSPMRIDDSNRPPVYLGPSDTGAPGPDSRRSNSVWEASLHQNLNRLDITNNTSPRQSTNFSRPALPAFSFPQAPLPVEPASHNQAAAPGGSDATLTPNRRQGWYGGPLNRSQPISIADRASPVESASSDGVPTPSTSHGKEAHPAIVHAGGMVEVRPPGMIMNEEQQMSMHPHETSKPGPARADSGSHLYTHARAASQGHPYLMQGGYDHRSYPPPSSQPTGGMGRLEALVAVATSENVHR